jgi:hypothetical protein
VSKVLTLGAETSHVSSAHGRALGGRAMAGHHEKSKAKFTRRDVAYYLDSQQHDANDASGVSRKNGQFFALRDKLLRLSDEEFDVAIRAIEGIVSSIHDHTDRKEVGQRTMNDKELREFADLAAKSTPANTSPSVKQVSRV